MGARYPCLPNHVDRDGTQVTEGGADLKVLEDAGNAFFEHALKVFDPCARHNNRANLRNRDLAVSVNGEILGHVNGAPNPQLYRVTRANQVIARRG